MGASFRTAAYSLILPEFTFEEQCRLAKETGYDGIELRVADISAENKGKPYSFWGNHKDAIGPSNIMESVPRLLAACRTEGMALCTLAPYTATVDPQAFELMARAAEALGVKPVRVMAPWFREGTKFDELFSAARKGLAEIEKIARRHGVTAVVEMHNGALAASPSGARRLVDGLDSGHIGVILDPGNMIHEGFETWRMACGILGPYLKHVHVKNSVWREKSKSSARKPAAWEAQGSALWEGAADWGEIIRELRAAGYSGWLSLEDFTDVPPREKLSSCLAFLKSLQ